MRAGGPAKRRAARNEPVIPSVNHQHAKERLAGVHPRCGISVAGGHIQEVTKGVGLSTDGAGATFRAGTASQAGSQKEDLTGDCR